MESHLHMNGHNDAFANQTDDETKTNLIVNYLPQDMSEDELKTLFASIGPLESCKLIKDKTTKTSLGYGFVNYKSPKDARKAIETLSGMKLTVKTIKVSYARPSSQEIKNANLYISGLPPNCSEEELRCLFGKYGDIITCKVLMDECGASRCVGFVRYDKRRQAEIAIDELNNKIPDLANATKALIVKFANPPNSKSLTGYAGMDLFQAPIKGLAGSNLRNQGVYSPMTHLGSNSLNGTPAVPQFGLGLPACLQPACNVPPYCIFVYNLPNDATELTLFQLFSKFGAINSVKVVTDQDKKCKGYGFVNMLSYDEALVAILRLNGHCLERGKPLQVSFKKQKNSNV